MNHNLEDFAQYFLEVSSEQRLKIIQLVDEKEYRLIRISKET